MAARRSRRRKPVAAVPAAALPPAFREKMGSLLGAESDAFFAALEREVVGLRVNTLRSTPEEAREFLPFSVEPLPFPPEGFSVPAEERPGKHPYHAAGLYYLQDPAAMAVAALLAPRPGERVADLSAAPGGKTTQIAALMRDEGFLLANDVHPARARELAGNLERFGVRNAVVSIEPVDRLARHFGSWFDRVLLDAPCSGEAMFCGSEAARSGWSEAAVLGCARRQEDLLVAAAGLVRPGGLLVYSTCTFSPEEDEAVVARVLDAVPDLVLEAPTLPPGAEPGRPAWVEPGPRREELSRTVRLWPHRYPGAGHFIAVFRRSGGPMANPAPAGEPSLAGAELALFESFRRDSLPDQLRLGPLTTRGQELFAVPESAPDLRGLRLLRPGWWLGTLRPGRFEPVHALAMGLRADRPARVLDLHDAAAVHAYLRGETLRSDGEPGWALVTTRGLPLGWGKRVGSTVKNHLPRGLRSL